MLFRYILKMVIMSQYPLRILFSSADFYFKKKNPLPRICSLNLEREEQRKTDGQRHASYMHPDRGLNPQPLGARTMLQQLNHLARAYVYFWHETFSVKGAVYGLCSRARSSSYLRLILRSTGRDYPTPEKRIWDCNLPE